MQMCKGDWKIGKSWAITTNWCWLQETKPGENHQSLPSSAPMVFRHEVLMGSGTKASLSGLVAFAQCIIILWKTKWECGEISVKPISSIMIRKKNAEDMAPWWPAFKNGYHVLSTYWGPCKGLGIISCDLDNILWVRSCHPILHVYVENSGFV